MAVRRDDPYAGFRFLVSIDGAGAVGAAAGFSTVSGLDREVEMITYRAGSDRSTAPRLVPGLSPNPTVTFERGVIGSLDLHEWVTATMDGGANVRRDLAVDLLDADGESTVYRWRLHAAVPTALRGPRLDASANAIAIETLVLRAHRISVA